jgi:hypothetical protein
MIDRPPPEAFTAAIADWPDAARARFRQLRALILESCSDIVLTETLKWGEPAWLPAKRGLGSTLRVAWKPAFPDEIALFVHCGTTIAATMRDIHPDSFTFDGNRALRVPLEGPLPEDAIRHLAALTLRYHVTRATGG